MFVPTNERTCIRCDHLGDYLKLNACRHDGSWILTLALTRLRSSSSAPPNAVMLSGMRAVVLNIGRLNADAWRHGILLLFEFEMS